jgi:hypothetical protein
MPRNGISRCVVDAIDNPTPSTSPQNATGHATDDTAGKKSPASRDNTEYHASPECGASPDTAANEAADFLSNDSW